MTAAAHFTVRAGQTVQPNTGMEPFFEFLNALVYAFTEIRIEWRSYQQYKRDIPQGARL